MGPVCSAAILSKPDDIILPSGSNEKIVFFLQSTLSSLHHSFSILQRKVRSLFARAAEETRRRDWDGRMRGDWGEVKVLSCSRPSLLGFSLRLKSKH